MSIRRYYINEQDAMEKVQRKQLLDLKYLIAEIKSDVIEGLEEKDKSLRKQTKRTDKNNLKR